jgi:hypothetical protein
VLEVVERLEEEDEWRDMVIDWDEVRKNPDELRLRYHLLETNHRFWG